MSDFDTVAVRYNSIGSVTRHAQIRFHDHYGHDLSRCQWNDVISDISEKRAVLLTKDSGGKQIWAVRVGEKTVKFICDPSNGFIVTTQDPKITRIKTGERDGRHDYDFNKKGRGREKHR